MEVRLKNLFGKPSLDIGRPKTGNRCTLDKDTQRQEKLAVSEQPF